MTLTVEEEPAFNLTDVDRAVLAQTDDEFTYHDWEELTDIIARGDLGILKRKPSDLLRYLHWTKSIKAEYGNITNYICKNRLHWPIPSSTSPLTFSNPTPFADASDYKILRNDWPYGLAAGITHLVVWSRTPIAVRGEDGVITEESRALIEEFVQRVFVKRLEGPDGVEGPQGRVLWFKNYTALQSVRGLEHIHILLREVPERFLKEWTGE
ncbi:GIG1 family protein [Aspergillus undulatus]|uniref:GIG1 family protein n=1 Tax=Aspergillus undulatus TaxID=1810928 RepID=UPI003CCDB2C6